jgi:endothelin-converting enzyme/putative endopeptidase
VEVDLGWALGQRYLEAAYSTARHDRARQIVASLERALDRDIQQLPWLSAATRQRALEIRAAILAKVGGPEGSADYSGVLIKPGDPLGNAWRAAAAGKAAEWASIERESDPRQWSRLPTTVNAFYDREGVTITIPAAILQPPFLDLDMDDAPTFGAAGSLIGHELMHAFDTSGQHHGERGSPDDWTGPDTAELEKRAACFARQYSEFTTPGGAGVDGGRTLDETLADAGGVRIAYLALQETLAAGEPPSQRDGFTADQRFFLGYGQGFCSSETPSYITDLIESGYHAPAKHRVNGIVSNMQEFQKAFSCAAGSKMVRRDPCRVW